MVMQKAYHIFHVPLDQRLKHDVDGLRCFLASYRLAVEEQTLWKARQSSVVRTYFFPRSLPWHIDVPPDDQRSTSEVSNVTLSDDIASFCTASSSSAGESLSVSSTSFGLTKSQSSMASCSGRMMSSLLILADSWEGKNLLCPWARHCNLLIGFVNNV